MDRDSPQPNVVGSGSLRALSPRFWLLIVATGGCAGLAGGLLMKLLRLTQHTFWPYRPGDDFLAAVQHASPLRIALVVTAAGFVAAIARAILRLEAPGGHAGDLAEAIWFDAGRLAPFKTAIRSIVSIVLVGMGAALGREAGPKQIGGLFASLFAEFAKLPDGQRRLLAACGAGAGIAAVYNVPFGGALFALEVLLGSLSLPLAPPALAAALIATAASWTLLPNETTYHIPSYPTDMREVAGALVLGPIAGLAAAVYVRLISWADGFKPKRLVASLAPIVVFAVLGGLAMLFPQLLGNGKGVVQQTLSGEGAAPLLLALLVLRPLATAACLGAGAPGGLFTPTLTVGALLGASFGHLWAPLAPETPLGAFALIGSTALLAAATQGPASAIILVLELTRRLDTQMVPTVLAVAGAVLVARLCENRSIYSGRIHVGRNAAVAAGGEKDEDEFIALSSAARFVELARATLQGEREKKPVYVIGKSGELIGALDAKAVLEPPPSAMPLEIATAADFARKT
jgi:chloride channel protein, CIC family